MADQQFKTKQEYVYEKLYSAIVNGELRPGERLRLEDVAQRLGTSRTPLREAARRLQTEGLIAIVPHRGVVVSDFSVTELVELYHIRGVLDGLAVRLAAANLTDSELDEVEQLLCEMERQSQLDPQAGIIALNWRFHEFIYRRANAPNLYEMISNLYAKTQQYRLLSLRSPERAAEILTEHRCMLDALRARDASGAERCAIEHDENTARSLIQMLAASARP